MPQRPRLPPALHTRIDGFVRLLQVRAKFAGNTDEVDVDGNTPVHWAAVKGHDEILKFLISKSFSVRVLVHLQSSLP